MSGFTNDIMNADNVNFTGANPTVGSITSNGQLLIGSASSPNIRPGFLTSNDGSIHVSNGPGTVDISGTAQGFQPNAVLQEFDDFYEGMNNQGKLAWKISDPFMTVGTTDHPGILGLQPSGALNQYIYFENFDSTSGLKTPGGIALGGGATTLNWNLQLSALSNAGNDYTITLGFADLTTLDAGSIAFVDGVYFQYNHGVNSGNWQIKSTKSSVTTTANTSTPADISYHTFSIVANAGGTSLSYYIDNVQVANSPLSTNIPTAAMTPMIFIKRNAGTIPLINIDLYWLTINLSNPRPGPYAGTITSNGRLIENYTQTGTNYQVLGTDAIIGVSNTAAPRTITMPSAGIVAGQRWTVKDESGGAAAQNITVSGNGYLVDGAASKLINTNYGAMDIYFNGSAYYII